MAKVSIIGAGSVGSTAAYVMILRQTASKIAIIDINKEKAEGEAMDLGQGLQFLEGTDISFGDSYGLCKDSDVVVITAGLAQKKGETRLDLVKKNADIFKQMIPKIIENAPDCVILVVTNPVDIMTYLTMRYSGLPANRILGTGTTLDTARFRYFLGNHFNINPSSVHAYILGEHGDSEFPVCSKAHIGGQNIHDMDGFSEEIMQKLFEKTKNAAYEIIAKKGATHYAIGIVIEEIVSSIIQDEEKIYPVSNFIENYYDETDLCLSTPCVIGKGGIKKRIQFPLNDKEQKMLHNSASILKDIIKDVE